LSKNKQQKTMFIINKKVTPLDFSDVCDLKSLDASELILNVLLNRAQLNDSNRIFASIRKPSKTVRGLLQDLYSLRRRRLELYDQFEMNEGV